MTILSITVLFAAVSIITYRVVSPSEYLVKYRIRKAIAYIENDPSMLIKEAAAKVGLKDQYYFSKLFKKETGMSPGVYFHNTRNQHTFHAYNAIIANYFKRKEQI